MDEEDTQRAFEKGIVPENEQVVFSLDNFDKKIFDSLPKWLHEKIAQSPEYTKANDDLPF